MAGEKHVYDSEEFISVSDLPLCFPASHDEVSKYLYGPADPFIDVVADLNLLSQLLERKTQLDSLPNTKEAVDKIFAFAHDTHVARRIVKHFLAGTLEIPGLPADQIG